MKNGMILLVGTMTLAFCVACGDKGKSGEEAEPKEKEATAEPKKEVARKAEVPAKKEEPKKTNEPAQLAEGYEKPPVGLVDGKVPKRFAGNWEKQDEPFKGMVVEFAEVEGGLGAKVKVQPQMTEESVKFRIDRGENPETAEMTAKCVTGKWEVDMVKMKEIHEKDGKWNAKDSRRLYRTNTCTLYKEMWRDSQISFTGEDSFELVVPGPEGKVAVDETWKKVSKESK